jgi:hypothetical protein
VALEVASTNEPLRLATAQVFSAWIEAASARLRRAGIAGPQAASLARSIIALLEGAFVLSRATKSTEPMQAARDAAVTLVRAHSA